MVALSVADCQYGLLHPHVRLSPCQTINVLRADCNSMFTSVIYIIHVLGWGSQLSWFFFSFSFFYQPTTSNVSICSVCGDTTRACMQSYTCVCVWWNACIKSPLVLMKWGAINNVLLLFVLLTWFASPAGDTGSSLFSEYTNQYK